MASHTHTGRPAARGRTIAAVGLSIAATALVACGSGSSDSGHASSASGSVNAANFVRRVDNPYFPLTPGTVYRNRGVKDGKRAVDVFAVTHRTKRILGVTATVVDDRGYLNGKLAEATLDWYAQDRQGNVWYFGEATRELGRNGKVTSTEGSWQSGVNGARPGIYMPAHPRVGDSFAQEHFRGHAEDHFRVLDLSTPITVPYRSFGSALLTKEWTPLEPGVIDHKLYVRGLGQVKEETAKGPQETLSLVSLSRGR